MVKLPESAKLILEKAASKVEVVIATASKEGIPNAVPVRFVKLYDDEHILIADNYFLKTKKNLEENPRVAVTFWDYEARVGYQVKGSPTIFTSGRVFEDAANFVQSTKPEVKTKAAVLVKVEEVYWVKGGPDAGKRIA